MKRLIVALSALSLSLAVWSAIRPTVGTTDVSNPVSNIGFADWNYANFTYSTLASSNLTSGNVDLATVPAGYRGMLSFAIIGGSTNSTSVTFYMQVKTNGNYFRLASNATVAQNAVTTITSSWVYDENETMAINVNNTGANLFVNWCQWPTNLSIQSYKLFSLASGSNTVFTVPSSVKAFPTSWSQVASTSTTLNYLNDSGASRTIGVYVLSPSQPADALTLFRSSTVNDDTLSTFTVPSMGPLDSIVINTDANTATQVAWITMMTR